jgi:outer membrane protein OmpA-like peptidoglycan-associated protein
MSEYAVQVDSVGCPVDSDKDGVPDYLDKCPDTPVGVAVDSVGCPFDDDNDGVPNYIDKCPHTPAQVIVDSVGCPIDTDGDGVSDYLDKCPTSPGPASNYGCPELKREVTNLFKKAMQGIQFETGKDVIRRVSYPILNQIADVMKENPTYNLAINGHTDDVGNDEFNQGLSERRAASVRRYLINQGIEEERMTSQGYGETRPIADNKTAKGRALNRRVEFEVSFKTVSYEKVINEELKDVVKPAEQPTDSVVTK